MAGHGTCEGCGLGIDAVPDVLNERDEGVCKSFDVATREYRAWHAHCYRVERASRAGSVLPVAPRTRTRAQLAGGA